MPGYCDHVGHEQLSAAIGQEDPADKQGAQLLDGLNERQIKAVTAEAGRTVVLAGAGSGKTRVLTRRVAWRIAAGQTDPARVLVLTFTRKAASELRQRQVRLGLRDAVPAGTFHSFALTQLRERWAERRTVPPAILDGKIRLLAQIGARKADTDLLDVAGELEWARARLIEPDGYDSAAKAASRASVGEPGFIAEVMTKYQQEKRRKRVVDFDDLLYLAIRDLQADPDYAEAIRWRHRHFYVDEFQDVNPLQHKLLELWLGDRRDLFVVGDPRQAIYGWNGSDPALLDRAAASAETVINLDTNYRSTEGILAASAAALGPDVAPLVAYRGQGPDPSVTSHESDTHEARAIAATLKQDKGMGRSWSDMAVLVRTNAQLAVIERELSTAGVPSRLRSGPGPLGSPEAKAKLKELSRPGIDLRNQLEQLDVYLEENTVPGRTAPGATTERINNLAALSRLVHDYLSVELNPTGAGLAAWIQTLHAGDVDAEDSAVDLVTFHGSKGLEWPIVHVAGVEVGFVPIAYARTETQLSEERRLLYVAMTRAADELHMHWSRSRTFGTKVVDRQPAPWLNGMEFGSDAVKSRRPQEATWRRHVEKSRRHLDEPPTGGRSTTDSSSPEEDLYVRLRAWRDTKARASGVPGRVILDDATLRTLARARPTSTAQLAAVADLRPTKLARLAPELLEQLGATGEQSQQ